MLNFTNNTATATPMVLPYIAAQCAESQQFSTSRFHSYRRVTTWKALIPKAITHRQNVSYVLTQDDYVRLMRIADQFSDERYPLYVPEFGLGLEFSNYTGSAFTVPTPPWTVEIGSYGILFAGKSIATFRVNATPAINTREMVISSGAVQGITPHSSGLYFPLRRASIVDSAGFSTTLKAATGTITYEFAAPRDYTLASFTTNDLPRPRSAIARNSSLPDTTFLGRRVRGRRGTPATQAKDNTYQANYVDSLHVRRDYYFKNVVAKALTTTSLIPLHDDQLIRFDAMLELDEFSVNYSRYQWSSTLNYSKRMLRQP